MGALHDAIKAASTEAERKAIKAQAWADRNLPEGWTTVYRSHTITLSGAMDASTGNVVLTMTVLAPGDVDITPATLNPITIVNPPYLVEDPSGDVEIEYTDVDGNPQIKKCRDDANAVLTRIIHQLRDLADKVIDGA